MSLLFLSYRRSDSQDITGRIYDRLVAHFGPRRVFKDVDNIPVGVRFPGERKDVRHRWQPL